MINTETKYCIEKNDKYFYLDWLNSWWEKTPFHNECMFDRKLANKLAEENGGTVKRIIITKEVVD